MDAGGKIQICEVAKGPVASNNQPMPTTLELNLVSNANGVSLASAVMKESDVASDKPAIVKGLLIVSGHEVKQGVEPKASERIRSFGDPQRALLILLLRCYGSGLTKLNLSSNDSPKLAASLVAIYRKQISQQSKNAWLAALVGCGTGDFLGKWFNVEGNTSRGRYCEIKLQKEKWSAVSLVIKVNDSPTPVPVADYQRLAMALDGGPTFAEPKSTVTIDHFELRIWSRALGCFAPGADQVKTGDRVQLYLRTNQPVYLYLVWLDGRGQVVTLHPWTGSKWEWSGKTDKVEALTLPAGDSNDAEQSWRVQGPAGAEHIIVMADQQKLERLEAQKLRVMVEGLKRHRHCPKPEVLVVSKFERILNKVGKPTRLIRRITVPPEIREFQVLLAAPLRNHFDQVLICTFANEGKI